MYFWLFKAADVDFFLNQPITSKVNYWPPIIWEIVSQITSQIIFLPMSSKRSTQTTNTFVSGPSGGKDFPVDDLFVFTKGLSYMEHRD